MSEIIMAFGRQNFFLWCNFQAKLFMDLSGEPNWVRAPELLEERK